MTVQSLLVKSAVFAAAIFLFPYQIDAQQVSELEGTRPDEMADLVAVAMTPSIAFPAPNEVVDVAVQVRNRSTHAEHDVMVALFAGTTKVADKVTDISAGETLTVHLVWKAQAGEITLAAQVDPDNKKIELDRRDNLISADLVVTPTPSRDIDLAVVELEPVQAPDRSTKLLVRIRNSGKAAARVPLVIRTDKQVTEVQLVEVAGDATITVEIPLAASQLPAEFSAEINPRHRLSEKHSSDNILVKDSRPVVDLRIEELSVSAAQFEQKRPRQVTISFRVVNTGATAISHAFRTSVFPGIIKADNKEPFGVFNVTTEDLPAGGTVYISQTIISPVGEFDVRVETDADNVIAESDERNNIAESHFKNPTPDVGRWVSIGPRGINDGGLGAIGRIHSIAVHPTTPNTIYLGAPNGGIWKTTDGGVTWAPVGDSLPTLAVAALAVDPITPTRLYLVLAGNGIYRSNDAAVSWTKISNDLGTPNGAGVLLIDPATPSRLYLTGLSGLFRSTDSGANWMRVKTGTVNDVVMDPSNPATLYVGVQGDGVFKTTTGGGTGDSAWNRLSGLPATGFTRITLALCQNVPNTIFAGLSGSPFRLFRSTDGATFSLRFMAASSIYNPWIRVDPADPSIVYVLSANFLRSTDGGATFPSPTGASADTHECQGFATDPVTPGMIYLGRDSGIFRSPDRGTTWEQIGAGITNVEFYDHAVAFQDPNLIIGGTQDNGTIRFNGTSSVWTRFVGGDGATVDIDPTNSQILYVMNQGQDSMSRIANGVGSCIGCTFPILPTCSNLHFQVHPTTPSTLLASCVSLWRANNPACPQCPNAGLNSSGSLGVWTVILPASVTAPGNVIRSAIDPSVDLYYAGTTIGELWAGPSGAAWQKVFSPTSARTVSDIEVDPDNPTIVYVSLSGGFGDRVFRLRRLSSSPTTATMVSQAITSDLPALLNINTLAVDRMTPFTIYAGTNRGVFRGRSTDNGLTWSWTTYNNGLPPANVVDLEVHPVSGVMRAASFGRSAFEVNTDSPLGTLLAAEGKITFLRVHDEGTGFGPPTDFLDAEVIVMLDSTPGRGFGFTLRNDTEAANHRGMLDILRLAFKQNRTVQLDYIRTGLRNGRIIRVQTVN